MAQIVLAIGTSHGPMLLTPPEQWGERVVADRNQPAHWYRGKAYSFDALAALRRKEGLAVDCGIDIWRSQYGECQAALGTLVEIYDAVKPDVAVIVGNDQREIFGFGNMPAICIYRGETVDSIPPSEVQISKMPPGIAISDPGYRRPVRTTHRCCPELADHLIGQLTEMEFDIAQSDALPDEGSGFSSGIPHAFGFIYRQIMRDTVIPHVPVILNTHFAPNQPTARRCLHLGQALARAIATWESDSRVVLFASGGLSHFVIDEDFDRKTLAAMESGGEDALPAMPESYFRSGTAELKNWLPVASAARQANLAMHTVAYVPCYRSVAGTGNAMGFVYWQ
jgi:hypothetical protein